MLCVGRGDTCKMGAHFLYEGHKKDVNSWFDGVSETGKIWYNTMQNRL